MSKLKVAPPCCRLPSPASPCPPPSEFPSHPSQTIHISPLHFPGILFQESGARTCDLPSSPCQRVLLVLMVLQQLALALALAAGTWRWRRFISSSSSSTSTFTSTSTSSASTVVPAGAASHLLALPPDPLRPSCPPTLLLPALFLQELYSPFGNLHARSCKIDSGPWGNNTHCFGNMGSHTLATGKYYQDSDNEDRQVRTSLTGADAGAGALVVRDDAGIMLQCLCPALQTPSQPANIENTGLPARVGGHRVSDSTSLPAQLL